MKKRNADTKGAFGGKTKCERNVKGPTQWRKVKGYISKMKKGSKA